MRAKAVAIVATPWQHADDGQGGNRPARGRGRAEQPGVERPHQWSHGAAGSDGAGMCWVPSRLRKTQYVHAW